MKRPAMNLMRLCAGLIAALVLGDIVSPATAQASCGDHVRLTRDANVFDPQPLLPATPCHGLNCSSRPDPIPLSPVTTRLSVPDVWDQLGQMHDDNTIPSPGWLALDETRLPSRLATLIFHPPR